MAESTLIKGDTRFVMNNNTNATTLVEENIGQPVIISLMTDKDSEPYTLHSFDYGKEYKVIPGRPSNFDELDNAGFSSKESSAAWIAYIKYAKKLLPTAETTSFSGAENKFNIQNGIMVIYDMDRVKVMIASNEIETRLLHLGFHQDETLYVPFSNKESYYDLEFDALLTWW